MKISLSLIVLLLIGCHDLSNTRSDASIELGHIFEKNNRKFIDFSTLQGNKWTKVCFLGPYNIQSSKTLGFDWDISQYTDVLTSDGHNVVVFATESDVINYIVHERRYGDFWKLSGQCFVRKNSKLYLSKSNNWHAGL